MFKVPRASFESVGLRSKCTHWTNLHCVAREVRRKWFVGECHDLRVVATLSETDERITGDFIGEARAAVTQNATFAVEVHKIANCNGLFVMALLFNKTTFTGSMTECLVLQWAFATLVTNRTIKWVVCKEKFEDSLVSALHLWCVGAHNLAISHWGHATHHHHRTAWSFHFNKALATHANRAHAWVITEARNVFICTICRSDDEFTFASSNCASVDGDGHRIRIWRWCVVEVGRVVNCCHCATAVTGMRVRLVTRASNSERNNVSAECTGAYADGPTKQMVFMRYGNGTAVIPSFALDA